MGTRVVVTLQIPDVQLDASECMPEWHGEEPPTADDVIREMKKSVNIHRLIQEWDLEGPNSVLVSVVTETEGERPTRSYAEWEEHVLTEVN